jgi:broad specificity phosphatase PhoE
VADERQMEIDRGRLLGLVAELGRDVDVTLLLRHSARERIADATTASAIGAQLTAAGRAQARAFGEALLPSAQVRLFYSPVPRCEETARLIADGVAARGGAATVLGPSRDLGAIFVRDPRPVMEIFAERGLRGFMAAWRRAALPAEALQALPEAGAELLASLLASRRRAAAPPPCIDVHVTHDLVILALLATAWDVDADVVPIPGYLDGAILSVGPDGAPRLWYHGEERAPHR